MTSLLDTSLLEKRAAQLVEAAKRAGADAADAVAARGSSISISVRHGIVEEVDRSEGDDFTLRVFVNGQTASVSTNAFDEVATVAERAVAMARYAPADPYAGFLDPELRVTALSDLELIDPREWTSDELTEMALATEAAALGVEGISSSIGGSASWGMSGAALVTSDGFSGSYLRSRNGYSVAVIAGSGTNMERDGDYSFAVFSDDLRSPEDVGRSAANRTLRRLNPSKMETSTATVLYDNRTSSSLIGHLSSAINGAMIARGTSFLKDKLGQEIFASTINVIDDPNRLRGLGSRPFDGEGGQSNPLKLIDEGRLTTWTLDSATGRELNMQPNGRARRGGSGTSPGTTNLHLEAGYITVDDAIKSIEHGILVTDMIGSGANTVTGDYSRGASGLRIEKGELTTPVSEITIAGNLKDMFAKMVPCDDLEFRGSSNAPSIMIEGLTIAGN